MLARLIEQPIREVMYRRKGHTDAVSDGLLRSSAAIPAGEIAIFEASEESIHFFADGPTRFVIGSAPRHPHDLVLGSYSVHTSEKALREGEAEIRRIGQKLWAEGTLRSTSRNARRES